MHISRACVVVAEASRGRGLTHLNSDRLRVTPISGMALDGVRSVLVEAGLGHPNSLFQTAFRALAVLTTEGAVQAREPVHWILNVPVLLHLQPLRYVLAPLDELQAGADNSDARVRFGPLCSLGLGFASNEISTSNADRVAIPGRSGGILGEHRARAQIATIGHELRAWPAVAKQIGNRPEQQDTPISQA